MGGPNISVGNKFFILFLKNKFRGGPYLSKNWFWGNKFVMTGPYCIQKLGGIAQKGPPGLVFYSGKTLGQSYCCTFTIVVVVGRDGRMGGTS